MIADIGWIATLLAFISTAYAAGASLHGATEGQPRWAASGRNAAIVVAPLLTVAVLALIYSLLIGDYQIRYVALTSNRAMPTFLKITALWGGQEGSLLFWSWLLAIFAAVALLRPGPRIRPLIPYVTVVTMVTELFFVAVVLFVAKPFARLDFVPPDGQGLNPLLRHPGMIFHPPALYLGFVGFTIPFAFGMAALITGQTDDAWIRATRRWTLMAWLFLSLGLLLGARWAYDVLGWGGYWGWDAVENAGLLPWLTGTAFLHSVMIQERRRMLKAWNMVLIILTYGLVIYGTFLTRSGVIESVHSFAKSAIGPLFLGFIAVMMVGAVIVLLARLDALRDENRLDALFSREAIFLFNNLLLVSLAFCVFLGTNFPLFSELLTGNKVTVGPPWFNRVTGPQFGALVALMGLCPLVAWRIAALRRTARLVLPAVSVALLTAVALFIAGIRAPVALLGFAVVAFGGTTTLLEYWRGARARARSRGEPLPTALWNLVGRNRRRYGGYLIHIGVVLMALGILGTHFYQQETQGTVALGETLTLGDYTVIYEDLRQYMAAADQQVTEATVGLYQGGRRVATLRPQHNFYLTTEQPSTIPALRMTLKEDFYIILAGWGDGGRTATFKLYVNPLVNWIWLGGLVFVAGTVVAVWPRATPVRRVVQPAMRGTESVGRV